MADSHIYSLLFEDGTTETLRLAPLGHGRYRAEDSSLWEESVNLGDIIEAEITGPDQISFLGVVQKSPYTTLRWVISKNIVESTGLSEFLNEFEKFGGRWERACGGLLLLHLPPGVPFDAKAEFKRLVDSA